MKSLADVDHHGNQRCQDIPSYAISTAAISTVNTFNRVPFQPRAISTASHFNRPKFNHFNYLVIN